MDKYLTDKNFVVMLKGGYKCYLNERQKIALQENLLAGKDFVLVDGFFFKTDDVSFILPASEIEREDKVKRGEWKCEYGFWHGKADSCGHSEMLKYN
jgi:hypothetical protein